MPSQSTLKNSSRSLFSPAPCASLLSSRLVPHPEKEARTRNQRDAIRERFTGSRGGRGARERFIFCSSCNAPDGQQTRRCLRRAHLKIPLAPSSPRLPVQVSSRLVSCLTLKKRRGRAIRETQ